MRAFHIYMAFAVLLAGTLAFTGCSRSANLMGGNVRVSSASLTPVAVLTPTNKDPLIHTGSDDPTGSLKDLQIELVYLNPKGYSPAGHSVYYIGETMAYEIHIVNVGCSKYDCLSFSAQHQYYENESYAGASASKGDALPGASTCNWDSISIPGHSMVVLKGSYACPGGTIPGIDQTAIQVMSCPTKCGKAASMLYYNPEQGVFDPPPTH